MDYISRISEANELSDRQTSREDTSQTPIKSTRTPMKSKNNSPEKRNDRFSSLEVNTAMNKNDLTSDKNSKISGQRGTARKLIAFGVLNSEMKMGSESYSVSQQSPNKIRKTRQPQNIQVEYSFLAEMTVSVVIQDLVERALTEVNKRH